MDKEMRNKIASEISNIAMLIMFVLFSIVMTMGIIFAITVLSQLLRG